MAREEELVRPSAVFAAVFLGPSDSASHIFDVLRVLHPGTQTVIGQHGHDAVTGQEFADATVQPPAALVADRPDAAVNQDDDRAVVAPSGIENIAFMPYRIGIGPLVVGDILHGFDLVATRRSVLSPYVARNRGEQE
jgi:hypothetical protein